MNLDQYRITALDLAGVTHMKARLKITMTIQYHFKEKPMNMTKLFPLILITLDVAAAVVYCCNGDIKRTIYWLTAATLTATVTF